MKRFGGLLFASLLAATLAACGGGADEIDGQATGSLSVTAQSVTNGSGHDVAEVDSVVVTLVGADATIRLELTSDGAPAPRWTASRDRLFVGSYSVSAVALDANDNELFVSSPMDVTVTKGGTTAVILMMNQQGAVEEHTTPFFTSVVIENMNIEQWESATITVQADGGVGQLALSGRSPTSLPRGLPGTFSAPAMFVGGEAQITWTPPEVQGEHWFVLTVTDSIGDKVELGVTIVVGNDFGAVDIDATWNLAPRLAVESRLLNDGDAGTMYLWLLVSDDVLGAMTYDWSASTCDGVFVDGVESGAYVATHQSPASGSPAMYFKYHVLKDNERGPCKMTVSVKDVDGAVSTLTLNVDTTLLEPVEG